jgi:glycosyltransferase involved in cell wall biosynthesis
MLNTHNATLITSMKRIAYASPLNPAPSGISDYSEELLPFLAQYAEIVPYADDDLRPTHAALVRHMDVRPLGRLERDHRRRPYDAIVYHMGNSPAHFAIWRAMQRVPGVVVLHEYVLHHFMLNYAAQVRRDIERYRAEAAARYGAIGERVAGLMMRGRFVDAAFELPFCEPVLAAAEGLIAHSRYVLERAAALRPGLPAAHVPMGVPLPPAIDRTAARTRLGLPPDALLLASFGHINPYKRVEAVLRALKAMRPDFPTIRYLLVGSVSPNYDLPAAIARAGLSELVTATGYVGRAEFENYVAAADICVNLRHPTAGETSASLLRLLGAGKPTLVTASGSFAELPPGVAAQVDLDRSEGDLILAYCRLLAEHPGVAAAMGAAARAYVAREHTLAASAAGYIGFLAARYGWGAMPKLRAPLWEPAPAEDQAPQSAGKGPAPAGTGQAEPPAPSSGPGLRPSAFELQPVAAAIAELGATEDDHALLESAARALDELGLG